MGTDNRHAKHKEDRRKREEATRNVRASAWLIICEGKKTEPNYFRQLTEHLNKYKAPENRDIRLIAEGLGKNTVTLVESLDDFYAYVDKVNSRCKVIPYQNVIIVFDKDSFHDGKFNDAVFAAENKYGALAAWSNESFELWLCLHFEYIDAGHAREWYNEKLTDIFKGNNAKKKVIYSGKHENYEDNGKNDEQILDHIVECGGSLENAMRNARKLFQQNKEAAGENPARANPATMVFNAVKELAERVGYPI